MILPPMTDEEFADWLRSMPRELPPEEAMSSEKRHDQEAGPWVGNKIVHHEYGESRDQL